MITKNYTIDKIEIVGEYKHVQVKQILIISENGQEISKNAHRYFLKHVSYTHMKIPTILIV